VEEFLESWGYLGIFLGLVATGVGFPMPEELPVVIGGALAGSKPELIKWYLMLPVTIAGVIVGDSFLYTIGRLWGPRLLQIGWIKRHMFPPDRVVKIEQNFHRYGVKLLLFARLTPGVRAPIFFTAGMTRLPLAKFLIADGLYAVPGVSLLFFLGWWFADSIGTLVDFIEGPVEKVKSIIAIVVVLAIAGYFIYRVLRKPAVTGDPHEMPSLVEKVTETLETVTSKIIHSKASSPPETGAPHGLPYNPAHPAENVPPPPSNDHPSRHHPSQPAEEPKKPAKPS